MDQQETKFNQHDIELDIGNILKGISFWEISVENLKLKLAENPNLDIQHVWCKLDKQNRGFVDTKQLLQFLAVNRIAASEREVEMLININSNQKGILDFNSFIKQVLPQTNEDLKKIVLNRKEIQQQQKVQHFTSDIMVGSFSEQQTAAIFGEELKFYRELEQLRSDFARNHGITTNQVYHIVNYQNQDCIDLNCLIEFFKKIGVVFSEDEFYALTQRITNDMDEKIDYDELINAIMPREPFDYPAFRQDFSGVQNKVQFVRKAQEFQTNISPYSFGQVPQQERQNPNDYYHPLRQVFNPYQDGRNSYFCDKGYMGQLKDYRDLYYKPNKSYQFHYQNEGKKGIRYHDSYFDSFYTYVHERDQNEQFFNKFGKRYQQDDKLAKESMIQSNLRDREQNTNYNSTQKFSANSNSNQQQNYNNTIGGRQNRNNLQEDDDTFL